MQKLFMAAAALTIAVATAPGFAGSSQAASAKSPYCDLAKNQRNAPSWNEHYGCLKTPARQASARAARARVAAPAPQRGPNSQYCELAKFQRNAPSWNEHYGCLKTPARQAFARAPQPARVSATAPARTAAFAATPERGPGSQYCELAKFQRNAPSWNEHYGCLRR
jgi:hypothetical protein